MLCTNKSVESNRIASSKLYRKSFYTNISKNVSRVSRFMEKSEASAR